MTSIPIVIICYNNYKYVDNTIQQLKNIDEKLMDSIIIVDNCSNDKKTIDYLSKVPCKIIYNEMNISPRINEINNPHIYHMLPEKFIHTDPDLEYNKNLPKNFIQILEELSEKYECGKIGFALDISDYNEMFDDNTYFGNITIYQAEIGFYDKKIPDDKYELYLASVDTTFGLVNKKYDGYRMIRIGGDFTAKHLPWYKKNKVYNDYENYIYTLKTSTSISTISRVIHRYIISKYIIVNKNDEIFLIENKDDPNINFWIHVYKNWEKETFDVFDRFLDDKKIFIDVGAWIGPTTIYASRKSKQVYSIEADNKSIIDLNINCDINCDKNITTINKAIYNVNDIDIKFGKNKFLHNSKLNDSTHLKFI